MRKTKGKPIALLMSLLLVAMLGLVGCGGGAGNTSSSSNDANSGESSAAAAGELVGKPWTSSILQGNLPAEAPEAKAAQKVSLPLGVTMNRNAFIAIAVLSLLILLGIILILLTAVFRRGKD